MKPTRAMVAKRRKAVKALRVRKARNAGKVEAARKRRATWQAKRGKADEA